MLISKLEVGKSYRVSYQRISTARKSILESVTCNAVYMGTAKSGYTGACILKDDNGSFIVVPASAIVYPL